VAAIGSHGDDSSYLDLAALTLGTHSDDPVAVTKQFCNSRHRKNLRSSR
jgi:hypothetical protein